MNRINLLITILSWFSMSSPCLASGHWVTETIPENVYPGVRVGLGNSLALDTLSNPHISYCSFWEGLKYAFKDEGEWHIQVVDGAFNNEYFTSIAMDSSNNPHISYYADLDNKNHSLKYAYWDGTQWDVQTVDPGGDTGSWNSLALNSDDCPHISYKGVHNRTDINQAAYLVVVV